MVDGSFTGGGYDSVFRETLLDWQYNRILWEQNKIFMVIAGALAASGPELSHFEVSGNACVSQDTLLNFRQALGKKSALVLKGLKTLKLREIFAKHNGSSAFLNSFIHFAPSLTELQYRSHGYVRPEIRKASDFLLPKLRFLHTLHITSMKFCQGSILRLLQTYSDTLRHLGLTDIRIVDGDWVQLFDELPLKFSLQTLVFQLNEEDDPEVPGNMRSVDEYFSPSQTWSLLAFMNGQSRVNPLHQALEEADTREKGASIRIFG